MEENMGNFLRKDIQNGTSRHIILATDTQLQLLRKTKVLFVDGTFRVVKKPFTQLFSLHGFISKSSLAKQVPLVYCLMSNRSKEDYCQVFEAITEMCPTLAVQEFVADFEIATWQALRDTFPGISIKGCVFHWSQAVFRKIQENGLQMPMEEKQHIPDSQKNTLAELLPADNSPEMPIIASHPFDDKPPTSLPPSSMPNMSMSGQMSGQMSGPQMSGPQMSGHMSGPMMTGQMSGPMSGPMAPRPPMVQGSVPEKIYPPNQSLVYNQSNPNAPPIYPCGICHKEVHENDQAILCESGCNFWFHRTCTGLTEPAFKMLKQEIFAEWVCDKCLNTKNIPLVKFKP